MTSGAAISKGSQVLLALMLVLLVNTGLAQVSYLNNVPGSSYYFTDHYEVAINKPLAEVWPHILRMGAWMPWMQAGGTVQDLVEGDVINIYDDFYVEVVKIIPGDMILLVNLPNSQDSEDSQGGVAMVTAKQVGGGATGDVTGGATGDVTGDVTIVSLFMSRIYYWFSEQENTLGQKRATPEFSETRKATYQEDFLNTLKTLAEAKDQ